MKRLAIYAHYGAAPAVEPYVLYFLGELRRLGFEICFVSNSPLSAASRETLSTSCRKIIERENTGLDFAMWQRGLAEYELTAFDELLLVNSSVIGPLRPLAPLWQEVALDGCDFWGLTDNREQSYHLQSYFLVFRRAVLQHPRFLEFWRSVLPYRNKYQVIRSYEVGLSWWLQETGFKPAAVFKQADICALFLRQKTLLQKIRLIRFRDGLPGINTPVVFPFLLLEEGMPFVKTSLLTYWDAPSRAHAERILHVLQNSSLPADVRSSFRLKEVPSEEVRAGLLTRARNWLQGVAGRVLRGTRLVRTKGDLISRWLGD